MRAGRKESQVREFPTPSAAISRVFYTRDSWNKISANDTRATLTMVKLKEKNFKLRFVMNRLVRPYNAQLPREYIQMVRQAGKSSVLGSSKTERVIPPTNTYT